MNTDKKYSEMGIFVILVDMFFPYSKLESKILSELAKGPKLVSDLVLKLQPITNQAVNYALRQLVSKRMIFKVKETVSINLFYLEEEKLILDTIFDTYKNYKKELFPNQNLKEGESVIYRLDYDHQIEDLWGSLPLLLLFEHNNHFEPYFVWDSIPFWPILHFDEFLRFHNSLKKRKFELLYGMAQLDSQLVRESYKKIAVEKVRESYLNHRVFKPETLLNVCGDYIISVKYGKAFVGKITQLIKEGNMQKLKEHMATKTKIVFSIEKDSKKAESYKKVFRQFFALEK